jgi:hypothetical protein
MKDFIEIAEAEIQRLRDEDEHLAATLRGIEARRAELARSIETGTMAIDYYKQVMKAGAGEKEMAPSAVTVKVVGPSPRRPKRSGGPTIATRLEDFMQSNGGEALVSELADHLVEVGAYPEDQRPSLYRRVYATLLRETRRFHKVGTGKFGLAPRGDSLAFVTKANAHEGITITNSRAGGTDLGITIGAS